MRRRKTIFTAAPVLLSGVFLASPLLFAEEKQPDGYTINYNTLSIIEYIKFASKICNANFIFNEQDLDFSVTIVSEGPTTPQSVMSTLIQVLRIHGLLLLEQDNNLVIHKSDDVKQLAMLVSGAPGEAKAPIVTRIFRIKNTNPNSLAAIIRPMISTSAILEVSSETRQLILTDVTGSVDKVADLIENLDSPQALLEIKSYQAIHNAPHYLLEIGSQIMHPIVQGNPFILVPADLSGTIYVVSTPELADKALNIFATLDLPPNKTSAPAQVKGSTVFVYKVVNRSGQQVLQGLENIADQMEKAGVPDHDLLDAIDNATYVSATQSIMFVGTEAAIGKIKEFLIALDSGVAAPISEKTSFFVYKPINRSAQEVEAAIKEVAHNLEGTKGSDPALIDTIDHARINPTTNTILFSGEDRTFARVKDLLAMVDTPGAKSARVTGKNDFFVYKIQSAPASEIESSLKQFAQNLDQSNAAEGGLAEAIAGMKYIRETNSLLFTGPESALKRLQELVPTFDLGIAKSTPASSQFYIYKPKFQRGEQLVHSIEELTDHLSDNQLADPAMLKALKSAKWVKSTNSILFTGDPESLKKIENLMPTIDQGEGEKPVQIAKQGYFIYKLQNTTGNVIEDDLDALSKNFKSSGLKDAKILDVIASIRYIKETNSLLLTGDPKAIDEVKDLISKYDYARTTAKPKGGSDFFMYKPQHVSAAAIQKSLQEVGNNLKRADLADPALLDAIDSARYVDTTNSLIFTGAPDTLSKIKGLIADIDIRPTQHTPIQHLGKTTFLLYKLKNASGAQITTSIKTITADLKKSGSEDKDLLAALNTMKYIRETNSLLFTGSPEVLPRVEEFVEKFDVVGFAASTVPTMAPQAATTGAPNFFVYKPQVLSGPELQKLVEDFAENLKMAGLADPDLFNTVASMRWIDATQSLLFTGNPKSLQQIKELLTDLDVSAGGNTAAVVGGPATSEPEGTIQSIDNTSFLVYKLQFHKGDEIQTAMRQIAKDLILVSAPINQSLLNSINSVQWLEVTNSLLCSGDQETLTRLRDLIKSLDIPLRQVFIEMLVVQTSLANALTFGLEWGGDYKYRTKFAGSLNNTVPPNTASSGGTSDPLLSTLNSVLPFGSATTPPTPAPGNISQLGPGFDLGIVGQVIKHHGNTYLNLSSLMAALQVDGEATIVMTPKIITQDGRTSSIFSGQNIPFAGSFVSQSGTNNTGTTNIEYRDIGVNLTITPVLGNSDIVTLDITLDQTSVPASAQTSQITFNQNGYPNSINGITSSKTSMQTTVHIPDNHFLILSGMVNNSISRTKSGIPCLGGLPVVGAAFSQDNDTIANTNIVIFLRPHILSSLEDMAQVTKNQEEYFRDQAGTPALRKAYDDALELMKTVDDE